MTRKHEAGQALIFGVVVLGLLLLGFAGLGIDVGYLRFQKRLQQGAVDSAAIAGASNLPYGGVTLAAQNAAATGGFTAASTGTGCPPPAPAAAPGSVAVTVNNPPCSGPHNADSNYVEVYVAEVYPTFFMRVLGIQTETVTARAVATALSGGTNNTGCMYTLDPPIAAIQGVNIRGSATLNAPSCGIADNGNFDPTGGALTVNAGTFSVYGTCSGSGCGKGSVSCAGQSSANCPAYTAPSVGDPLAGLAPPCSPCTGGGVAVPVGNTFSPGTYSSIPVGPGNWTFSPGQYIIDGTAAQGGLSIGANANVTGTGVFFYFTNGATVNVNGTPNINLSAPTSGTYSGILMYQDPLDTNVGPQPNGPILGGNSGSDYAGILYFPADQLTFYGNSTAPYSAGVVISGSFALSGNPNITLTGLTGITPPGNFFKNAVLVE